MEVTYFQEPGKNFKEPFLLYFIAHFCAGVSNNSYFRSKY